MEDSTQSGPLSGMTYSQRTFGCQMNVHDAERVAGMLEAAGATRVETIEEADIVVFLTCCVREAADVRLMGQVASMKNIPPAHDAPRIVAVGGCIGQRDGAKLQEALSHVDIVFGTHNIGHLVELISERREGGKPVAEVLEVSDEDVCGLPIRREEPWRAWVPIMTGCNNFCTYCIVPYVRGRERSRPIEDVFAEIDSLAAEGVQEAILLGQNVNSYGRDLYGSPRFSEVLEHAGRSGLARVRFITSHPKDISPLTIEAFASYPNLMPHLHLPLQSGSDRILKLMNRSYDTGRYLEVVDELRDKIPDISLSTDIIVGFPGETEEDFCDTLSMVEEVGYGSAYTFIYSRREGTPAAEMEDDTPHEVIQDRFDRLVDVVQKSAYEQNQKEAGVRLPVLFDGVSKRDGAMLNGKSPKDQTVHVPLPDGADAGDFAGRIREVEIEEARTWYLKGRLADG
ncbi:MAG: tRNA (N6-isopentenyl adenosine(37)-C2)-methylthiotransferase MiaB [Coriobacteriaceae bacterium]|nr:tRNA (N6-isopentenyl adenosine(37)-C2)-methylthiotransferase MiaB [Coriobacteriaceae bacterium]